MRERVPDIAIRTTFIVGFPGEGEAEFGELCEFVRDVEFDNLGAFTYSPEPGSGSEALGDPVSGGGEGAAARLPAVAPAADRAAQGAVRSAGGRRGDRRRTLRGDRATCSRGGSAPRRPEIDGRLLINDTGGRDVRAGEIVRVEIGETHEYDVVGRIVD